MPTLLKTKRINTVGFVDSGANQHSDIVIWKRDEKADHPEDHEDEDENMKKRIVRRGERFCVVSEDGSETLGCHDSREEAMAQLRAVEANKRDGMDEGGILQKLASILKTEVGEEDVSEKTEKNDQTVDEFDIESLEGEARKAFEELQERLEKAEAQVAELSEEPEGESEDVDKSDLPEAVRKRLEAVEKRAEEAEKRAQELQDEKERSRFISKAQSYKNLPGVTGDDFGPTLRKIHDALDEDEFEAFEKILKSANETIGTGEFFREIGSGGVGLGSVEAEVTAKVEEVQKADPDLSAAKARAKVWKENPDLYQRYQQERQDRLHARGVTSEE